MSEQPHRPRMSTEDADRLRRWHDDAYRRGAARTEPEQVDYLEHRFTVPPDVMPITPVSHLLGEAVLAHTREGDRVLDLGTGTGVNAVLAASRGAQVEAVDINPSAVAAARANAAANGYADRITVRHGDGLDEAGHGYHLIVLDPPFRWFRPRNLWEAATAGQDYRLLRRFFAEAPNRLAPNGKILLFFGSTGDLAFLRELIDASPFEATVVAEYAEEDRGHQVRYLTTLLTR